MWHWDKEANDDFTGDFGRHRTWRSARYCLCHRYPQGCGRNGASLQPGSSEQVRNAGAYNTRKNKAERFAFQRVSVPGYIAYVLVCVYALNGAKGFVQGFWQLLVILSVMNLIDRFWVDGYWVGHTNAWEIPGTEDLKPYITAKDKIKKWLFGTVGMTVISAVLAAIMMLFMKI